MCWENSGLLAHRRAEEAFVLTSLAKAHFTPSPRLSLLSVFVDLGFLVTDGSVLSVAGTCALPPWVWQLSPAVVDAQCYVLHADENG